MEIMEAIRTRRAAKGFLPVPVPREALIELIDAARYSPSGGNKNPWQFILVTQRKALNLLSETHPHCRWFNSAPAGIAIVVDPKSTRYWLEDCCVAASVIWLAATDRGLRLGWAAMYQLDSREESERRQRLVRRILAIPENLHVPIVLGVGQARDLPVHNPRPRVEDIVFWESYGKPSPPLKKGD
ncbi:MAG: nitroreductase family protein [Chloroflexi bacterium]|nr:nitroreductase family protein [Chloroflexota bacterium]